MDIIELSFPSLVKIHVHFLKIRIFIIHLHEKQEIEVIQAAMTSIHITV